MKFFNLLIPDYLDSSRWWWSIFHISGEDSTKFEL